MERVLLSFGNGGLENANLINKVFLKYFGNFAPYVAEDSGIFSGNLGNKFAVSTDSYTITPIFFKGGDIGKLSVCGSSNDVAVMGARPKYLTASFIIKEGFLISDLEKIAKSMADEIKANDMILLSADTKVVSKDALDSIFITTTAIGEIKNTNISSKNLKKNDVIILSSQIGAHGASIYCLRNDIKLENNLQSDCASLYPMIEVLLDNDIKISAMRDATRGGIASLLNEWAASSNCNIQIEESEILIPNEVQGICEILGLEPYSLANEGVCAFAIDEDSASLALDLLHKTILGKNARIIGKVIDGNDKKVILQSRWGTKRYLDYPEGEILPRIC